jgi:hypothetical protein
MHETRQIRTWTAPQLAGTMVPSRVDAEPDAESFNRRLDAS